MTKNKETKKQDYLQPVCCILFVEAESPVCTSVYHKVSGSFEPKNNTFFEEYNTWDAHSGDTDWEREDVESGTIEF